MKSLILFLFFTFCLGVRGRESIWIQKCPANSGGNPTALAEINDSEKVLRDCVYAIGTGKDSSTEDFRKLCQPTAKKCFQDFVNKWTLCLADEEDFLGDYFLGSHANYVEDICTEEAFPKFIEFVTKIRSDEDKWMTSTRAFSTCVLDTNTYKMIDAGGEVNFRKDVLCGDLHSIKDCMIENFASVESLSNLSADLDKVLTTLVRWCDK